MVRQQSKAIVLLRTAPEVRGGVARGSKGWFGMLCGHLCLKTRNK
jgi:hypothetical protein